MSKSVKFRVDPLKALATATIPVELLPEGGDFRRALEARAQTEVEWSVDLVTDPEDGGVLHSEVPAWAFGPLANGSVPVDMEMDAVSCAYQALHAVVSGLASGAIEVPDAESALPSKEQLAANQDPTADPRDCVSLGEVQVVAAPVH